jgi:hypothetical protein
MFRKGGLSSEDTGIVSGLGYRHRQGYADGPNSQGVQPDNQGVQPDNQGVQPSIFSTLQDIYDVVNPSAETVLKRLQQRQQEEPEPLIKTQAYRAEQKRLAENYKNQNTQDPRYQVTDQDQKTINPFQPKTAEEYVNEIKPALIAAGLGPDQDALTRQRYLELARVGFNLASQPTPVGYKPNLLNSIARAAEPSIAGIQKIEETAAAQQKGLNTLAADYAIKKLNPTDRTSEAINNLVQNYKMKLPEAINLVFKGGETAAQQAQDQSKISSYQSTLKNQFKDETQAGRIANNLLELERSGAKGANPYNVVPYVPNQPSKQGIYYADPQGNLLISNGKGGYQRPNLGSSFQF